MKTPDTSEYQIEPAIEHRAPRRQTTGFNNLHLTAALAGALAVGGCVGRSEFPANPDLQAAVKAEVTLQLDKTRQQKDFYFGKDNGTCDAKTKRTERDLIERRLKDLADDETCDMKMKMTQTERDLQDFWFGGDGRCDAKIKQRDLRVALYAKIKPLSWGTVISSEKKNEQLCVPTCKELRRDGTIKETNPEIDAAKIIGWMPLIETERDRATTTGNDCASICENLNKEVCARIAAISQAKADQTTLCNPAKKTTSTTPTMEDVW